MTNAPRRLMAVLAHPDDESLGVGGTLARYAQEGVETYLVTATRGERGRCGDPATRPSDREVGQIREAELLAAAKILGVREVSFLDYMDAELAQADPGEATGRIVDHILRVKPQVVVTFAPDGAYGHPDHIAICQLTTAAVVSAAARGHAVSKLYYMAWPQSHWDAYQAAFKNLTTTVGDEVRSAQPWPEWEITTFVDTLEWWPRVWEAVSAHHSQVSVYKALAALSPEHQAALWGTQYFYRAMSLVNGGSARETDLFEAIR